MRLTNKWLIERGGCPKGVRWFKKNYPEGMTFTKKDINELVSKLLKRKTGFEGSRGRKLIRYDTCDNLDFLIHQIKRSVGDKSFGHNTILYDKLDWEKATQKEITEAFWKDYRKLK